MPNVQIKPGKKYSGDTLLYEYFQYAPLQHAEGDVKKQYAEAPKQAKLIDPTTFVGIEVEVERMLDDGFHTPEYLKLAPAWACKPDGSLRNNGREFVSLPIRGDAVMASIDHLGAYLNKCHKGYEFSERTSVHVHVNVRKMSLEQIATLIVVYLSVEKSIFKFIKQGGWDRSNNIFCVSLAESDFYVGLHDLLKPMQTGDWGIVLGIIHQMWRKYTAFNTLPVSEKGTVEFRHMGGTINAEVLRNWINLILCLKKYAETHSLEQVINTITDLNVNSQYDGYLLDIFGPCYPLVGGNTVSAELEEGVCTVKDILLWAVKDKDYPDTIESFKDSSAFRFLQQNFQYNIVKTDLIELEKEFIKLGSEIRMVVQLLNATGGPGIGQGDEWMKQHKLYQKMQDRMYDLAGMLGKRPGSVKIPQPGFDNFDPGPDPAEPFFDPPVPNEEFVVVNDGPDQH